MHESMRQQVSAYVHAHACTVHVMHMNASASEARRCGARDMQAEAEQARRLV
jgi:hypothetical protein